MLATAEAKEHKPFHIMNKLTVSSNDKIYMVMAHN